MPAYFDAKPPREKKRPSRIASESKRHREKRLAQLSGPQRKTIPKRSKPVSRNKKRQANEFARCYHSKARVEFVKSLACFATGVRGKSDNAHVCRDGSEGMGRKGGYRCIAPLIREAHRLWDTNPARFTERYGEFDGQAMADWTQREWEKFAAREGIECAS